MSGFVALVHFDETPVDQAVLVPMMNRLTYRGIDRQTTYFGAGVALGHTLFRTTFEDQHDQQPLELDHVLIAGDMRLDARADLVQSLRQARQEVASELPDSELVLRAYLAWGDQFADHLFGDYSFVLWDARSSRLLAVRDRFGLSKLYYAWIDRHQAAPVLIVSNDLGAVRLHPLVTEKLNDRAIGDFLLFGSHLWLDKASTSFNDIRRVPPAHLLCADRGSCDTRPYWQLPTNQPMLRYRSEQDYLEHFRQVFKTAIRDRVRSDSIVLSLSGGLDLPSVAAMLCEMVNAGEINVELQTVTTVFDRLMPDEEGRYAGLVASHLHLPTHFLDTNQFGFANPPSILSEPLQVYENGLFEQNYRETIALGRTVMLGVGGDELLFPTSLIDSLHRHSFLEAVKLYGWLWRFSKRRPMGTRYLFSGRKRPPIQAAYGFPPWLNPDFERSLNLRGRWDEYWNFWYQSISQDVHPRHEGARNALLKPSWELVMEFARTPDFGQSRAVTPFFDLRLIDFVFSLPPAPWLNQKYLLRRAMIGHLPQAVLERPKTPLGYVLKNLLDGPNMEWLDHWSPVPQLQAYVNRPVVPPVTGPQAEDVSDLFVHVRPFLLNSWMSTVL